MSTRPLLEENATEIEKLLLHAGREEEPDRLASTRLLGVLQGLPPAPGGVESGPGQLPASLGSGMGTTAAIKSAATWVKISVLALGVGAAGVATHRLARPHLMAPHVPSVQPSAQGSAPARSQGEEPASGATVNPTVEPLAAEASLPPRKAPPAPRPREAVREPLLRTASAPPDHSLAVEISALDRARDSLEAHRFAEALRLLGEYHRQFPSGRMRPEATVLRLTALIKSGQHEAAQSLADQLLADGTYHTYAPRIRSLLKEMQR